MDMETAVPCGYEDVGAMPLCDVKNGYGDGDAMRLRRWRGYAPL